MISDAHILTRPSNFPSKCCSPWILTYWAPLCCRGGCFLHMAQTWTKILALLTPFIFRSCNSKHFFHSFISAPEYLLLLSLPITMQDNEQMREGPLLRAPKGLESLCSVEACWMLAACYSFACVHSFW